MKNLILVSFILFSLSNIYCQNKSGEKIIKLKLKNQDELRHFESHDYILSFRLADLIKISNDLNFSTDLITSDTLIFRDFIKKIDSLGKGNRTNDFRFNESLRRLIDRGSVRVYSIHNESYVSKLVKVVDNVPAAGRIYSYKVRDTVAIDFAEAFVGTPRF